jgi:multimeric flavodoxin WrbA
MKILAINGSPRGKQGNTERILENFMTGAQQAGAEIETVYLNEKKIYHCTGCFGCWTKTPGKCVLEDDMAGLLEKVKEADVRVFATPLYYCTVTGMMKDFMDRMLPLVTSEMKSGGIRDEHTLRYKRDTPVRTVLISNCGFPGEYNFSALLETFRVITKGQLDAAILRSQGGILGSKELEAAGLLAPYFAAVRDAGRQIVEDGVISPEVQLQLEADFLDPQTYMKHANQSW